MNDDSPERDPAPPGVSPGTVFPNEAPLDSSGSPPPTISPPYAPPPGLPIDARVGLGIWLGTIVAGGIGGLLLGAQDLSALTALAGVFVVAHAADLDPRWRGLNHVLTATLCAVAAVLFVGMGVIAQGSALSPALKTASSIASGVGAIATLVMVVPFVARDLARILFRTDGESAVLQLAARLTVMALILGVVGSLALRPALEDMLEEAGPLLGEFAAGGSLIGYIVAAFASVGLLIRRGGRETLKRLGIVRPTWPHLAWIIVGVALLAGMNTGFDALEHRLFPQLWQDDQRVSEAIAGGLTPLQLVVVALSAGIGEELTLRGALQPKLGIVLTSLVFALLHVQYSWFGMVVILVFGLTLGLMRRTTNTTVVIGVHTLYDAFALTAT